MSLGAQSPDFAGAAQQQAQSSQANTAAQTQANRANQTNAFGGNVQWVQDPKTGQWTQSTGVGGPLGSAVGSLEGQAAANAGQPLPTGQQAREQAINAAYTDATRYLDPQWNQRQEQTDAQLANEGLDPNSLAARNAEGNLALERNNAYGSAMSNAIGQGTEAGNTIFQEGIQSANQPYSELGAIRGLSQAGGYNQAGVADPLQALAAAQGQGQFNLASNQQMMQLLGGLLGGGGSALSGIGSAAALL